MKRLTVFFLILLSINANGQKFFTVNYGTEQGLPSNQIYDVIQDQTGYIWIATSAGVSRFDGSEMLSFTQEDGLSDNAIVQMKMASDGTLWFLGFNKTFTLFKDTFSHYKHNKKLLEKIQNRTITSFFPSTIDTLYLGLNTTKTHPYGGLKISNGEFEVLGNKLTMWVDYKKELFEIANSPKKMRLPILIQVLESDKDLTLIAGNKELIALKNGQVESRLKLTTKITRALLLDNRQNIWVGTYQGLMCYQNRKLVDRQPIITLPNLPISCVYEDKDGSIWFGTFSNGLFQIPNTTMLHYSNLTANKNNDFRGIIGSNKEIMGYNRNNTLVKLFIDKGILFKENEISINDNISQLFRDKGQIKVLTENQLDKQKITAPFKGISIALSRQKNTLWLGGLYDFSKIENDTSVFNSARLDYQHRVNCLVEVGKNHLWLGTVNGLYEYKDKNIRHIKATTNMSITDISQVDKDKIIFGTNGKGLGVLTMNTLMFLNQSNGLSSNFINAIKLEKDKIWVATNLGLNLIKDNSITIYDRAKGLFSEDISAIALSDSLIILSTTRGLVTVQKKIVNQPRTIKPPIIKVNGKEVNDQVEYEFDYDKQNINIQFIAFDYFQKSKLNFRYKLNSDNDWNTTTRRNIRYESLPPGSYIFEVQLQDSNRKWLNRGVVFAFKIMPPFYQKTWFYLLIVTLVSSIFYFILQWQIKKSKKRLKIENELSDLKLKALSAQMNPHFIFNSLNSIQNFLVDSDIRKSNKYLTKFAKLMRLVLNNSDNSFVPINDVLTSLDLYLELEKLRFSDKFDYELIIDNKINRLSTQIPAMLIQPFVENAILHGILPKKEKGYIKVSIQYLSKTALNCVIEDNGVGRHFHKDKIGKKYKSQGLRITQERLKVYEQLFKGKFVFSFYDLKDELDKPCGTKVELVLPSC